MEYLHRMYLQKRRIMDIQSQTPELTETAFSEIKQLDGLVSSTQSSKIRSENGESLGILDRKKSDIQDSHGSQSNGSSPNELRHTDTASVPIKQNQQVKNVDYWRNNYLSLQKIHEKMVRQLQNQLNDKNDSLRVLKAKQDELNKADQYLKHNFKANSNPNKIQNKHEKEEYSIVPSLMETIQVLKYKIQELVIEKQHSELKQEEWLVQYQNLMKQIKSYEKKLHQVKVDQSTNTEGSMIKINSSERMTEREGLDLIKAKLLGLQQSQNRLSLSLQQNSVKNQFILDAAYKQQQNIFRNKLNSILNSSSSSNTNSRLEKQAISSKTNSTFHNTTSSFMTQNKSISDKQKAIAKVKWELMKQNMRLIKKDVKVLLRHAQIN